MVAINIRKPQDPDVLQIPTPPHQATAIFIIFFFTALALVAVCVRIWTRVRVTRHWGHDDTLIVPAMLSSLIMCGPFYMYIKLGYFGWHQEDVPAGYDPGPSQWWFYISQIFYNPPLALVKCSVLVFILRLGSQRRLLRYAIYALIGVTAGHAIAVFFGVLLRCLPIAANWDTALAAQPGTKCISHDFDIAISSITILTDILVLVLPFPVVLGLKMPMGAKIAVIGVFLSGGVVTLVSIIRLSDLVKLFYNPAALGDPFFSIGNTLSIIEVNVAIAAACVPSFRALFRVWFPSLFGGSSDDSGPTPYGSKYGVGSHKRGLSNPIDAGGIALRGMRIDNSDTKTEIRGTSPTGSEEAILAYNGIIRTMDIQVHFDDKASRKSTRTEKNIRGKI
ncbi:hypothetical protein F4780DRAFT_770778 [Xylariomycetidae sp. FL0641]|nr:hypothetical protein F4780DRAFT_770778 [Xylariomycetidae sp. FL0641]